MGFAEMVAMWWLANDERKKEQAQAMRRASQVATLRSWSFHYDSKAKEYSIFFGLLNVDDEPVAADVYVDIRIVNNRNEEVYKATKLIFKDNYAYYETPFSGTEYLAEIKIAASELEKGKSNSGKVFLKVYNHLGVNFEEVSCEATQCLRVK